MKYKLLALDLDGTLLIHGKSISEENIKAIDYAKGKGVIVVIATGRITTSGRVFANKLGLETFIISSNGARVFDIKNKKVIYEDGMDVLVANSITEYFESLGTYYHAYVDDVMYARYEREQLNFYTEQNKGLSKEFRMDIRICENYKAVFEKSSNMISKVMTITDDIELLGKINKHLSKNKKIVTMTSNWNNIEVMNSSVSKGNALMHLSNIAGIKREEVISIGDNDNDLSMIKWAGMGIAMGNAIDNVKKAADDITENCEDNGVAAAIYKYVK